jgi:signal peptidase I
MSPAAGVSPWRFVGRLAATFAIAGAAVLGVTRFVVRPWIVAGASMEPTLRDGERILVDLYSLRRRSPRLGEIVLLEGPSGGADLVKRVTRGPSPGREFGGTVYFVTGDNPSESLDSRAFGPVPRSRMRGRVVYRYWPPGRAGRIE